MNSRPTPERHRGDLEKVLKVLAETPSIDCEYTAPIEEFRSRVHRVNQALKTDGHTVGLVFSDEHYAGDVPYLGGNTNISIEQVAGVVGPNGFHVVAGLEGGYVAEQLADRAGAKVHKVELLQLADEKYPIRAERLEDVIRAAAEKEVDHIALLTPRQVIPAGLVEYLENLFGKAGVVDAQELYYRVKYEKSEIEMRLIADACVIADAMLGAMLAVLRPGRLETEVAAWGAWVGRMLGSERDGFQIMVGANTANRTLIGPALNRRIHEGDWVHLGVAPKRDGLTACLRRSVIAVESPQKVTSEQKYWFDLVEEGYKVGEHWYREVAAKSLPARLQEKALIDFFAGRSEEISRRIGKKIDIAQQKPYTGTHNSGYTECQEFFGAITLDSHEPLGNRIVTMLDVALRGIGDRWNDVVIPGFDFCVVENTLGKYGARVETLTRFPIHAQELVDVRRVSSNGCPYLLPAFLLADTRAMCPDPNPAIAPSQPWRKCSRSSASTSAEILGIFCEGKLSPLAACDQLEVVRAVWQRRLEKQAGRTLDQPVYARAGRRCTLSQAFEESVIQRDGCPHDAQSYGACIT